MIDFDGMIGSCVGAFGTSVVYTQPGHLPQPITAVFFRSSMQLLPMGGSGGQEPFNLGASGDITTREPILGVQLSQLHAEPMQGDTAYIVAEKLVYQVQEVLPDGVGHAKLRLTLVIGG